MARPTAQSWLIPWPLETPASEAPGNTCGCLTHVVCDEPDAWRWCGSLGHERRKEIIICCVFSAPVSFGRCGSRVSGSFPDLRLHTRWDPAPKFSFLVAFDWRMSSVPSHLQVDGILAPPTGHKMCSSPTVWRWLKKCWVCDNRRTRVRVTLSLLMAKSSFLTVTLMKFQLWMYFYYKQLAYSVFYSK